MFVVTSYLNTDTFKLELLQKKESRPQLTDSLEAYC